MRAGREGLQRSLRSSGLAVALAACALAGCGRHQDAGEIEGGRLPDMVIATRSDAEAKAARTIAATVSTGAPSKQILLGDLHVHTTFSADAFMTTLTVNASAERCTKDESGRCIETRPCYGDYRTPAGDDCTAPSEERAWSSPIYVAQ